MSPKTEHGPKVYAIVSLILGIIPIIIWLLIFVSFMIVADGNLFGDVGGALWPLFLIVAVIAVIVSVAANIFAVIFGVIAVVKRKTLFSWIGIIIVAIEILIFTYRTLTY